MLILIVSPNVSNTHSIKFIKTFHNSIVNDCDDRLLAFLKLKIEMAINELFLYGIYILITLVGCLSLSGMSCTLVFLLIIDVI